MTDGRSLVRCPAWASAAIAIGLLAGPSRATPAQPATPRLCAILAAPADGVDATTLVQRAIESCAKRHGGRVTLGAGRFVVGPLRLASRIDLHLDRGARLEGSTDHARYRAAYVNWAFRPNEALISAVGTHDVAITGDGTIDGRGDTWWPEASADREAGNPKTIAAGMPASNGLPRPSLIEAYGASRITIRDVHIVRSPMWTIALRYTQGATIGHVDIENPADSPNTDGIDIVASRNVTVRGTTISTGDDCIAIKSGLTGSHLPPVATDLVRLSDLHLRRGHGLSIGSETLFGIRNVTADHIDFDGTDNGLRIKSGRDRGNRLEHFHFSDISMRGVGTTISISAYYPKPGPEDDPRQPVTATTPFIRDVTIRHLRARESHAAGIMIGLPESPLRSVVLRDVAIQADRPLQIRNAEVALCHVHIVGRNGVADVEHGGHVAEACDPTRDANKG
ncbi:glycoside hydrolase family 28 protein [Sphingomonas abietis]|uniref:Glycosyl hydrolase family 28 protein n=1 Tax=Sphingomonas abietis TaxID=3012344 RepID=A0ABY7NLJ6_9SPHN|nr:glycosyl hydrolase family 28 protein [Sphingomonas abietis]WBO21346.1 glycosyl hydrolase family 28 protein [Sphingomonas abietis]